MSNLKLLISYNLLPIGGLFLLFISIMVTWGNVIDYNVYKNGFLINATVLEAPVSCENISSRGGFCTLEYKGNKYITRAGKKFCYLVSGQKSVQMITDENSKYVNSLGNNSLVAFLSVIICTDFCPDTK